MLTNHKENCLNINGIQSVKLEKGIIEFKNYCRQIHCPLKIYAGFKCNLERVEIYGEFYQKKNTIIIFLVVLLTKLFALMIDLVNRLFFFRGENAAYEFIKAIL